MPPTVQKLLATVLPFVLAFALATCGSPQAKTVTVAIALLPSEQEPYRKLLDSFSEKTGIEVTLIAQQYQQIRNALEAETIAGRGELDVVELDVYLLGTVRDQMYRLDTLVKVTAELESDISPDALRAGQTPDGGYAFLPHRLNWQAMLYDAVELSSPPRTWEELMAVARSHPGKIGLKGARYEGMVCDLFPFLWQAGGDPLHPDAPGSLIALRFLSELGPLLNPAAPSYRENSILQAQERSEILLHFNWPFVVPLLTQKGLLGPRIRIAPLPAGPAGSATVLGGGYVGIPLTAPHPSEASKLLEFLVSQRTQESLAHELGWFPVRESVWRTMDTLQQRYAGFIAMRNEVRSRPSLGSYDQLSALWQEAFSQILFDHVPAERVAKALSPKIEELIHTGP